MIVIESDLAPHRAGDGLVQVQWRGFSRGEHVMPSNLFTPSYKVLQERWHDPKDVGEPGQTLQVTPVLAFMEFAPPLRSDLDWLALEHQCAGHYTGQARMVAALLTPRPETLPALNAIAREFHAAEGGWFIGGDELTDATRGAYVAALERAGLTCERGLLHLCESLYPVDATAQNLASVAQGPIGPDDLLAWSSHERVRRSGDPVILLLTKNSD